MPLENSGNLLLELEMGWMDSLERKWHLCNVCITCNEVELNEELVTRVEQQFNCMNRWIIEGNNCKYRKAS